MIGREVSRDHVRRDNSIQASSPLRSGGGLSLANDQTAALQGRRVNSMDQRMRQSMTSQARDMIPEDTNSGETLKPSIKRWDYPPTCASEKYHLDLTASSRLVLNMKEFSSQKCYGVRPFASGFPEQETAIDRGDDTYILG